MPDALLPTVLSRCQRLRFGELSAGEVAEALMRDHEYEETEARAAAAGCGWQHRPRAVRGVRRRGGGAGDGAAPARAGRRGMTDPGRRFELAREVTPSWRRQDAAAPSASSWRRACARSRRCCATSAWSARRATRPSWRMPISRRSCARWRTPSTATAPCARTPSVDEALAALERNASPKVVADWLVLQL